MMGAGIIMINMFFKEIWSMLQLPINFSYTFDARFVKHAFMIHLSMFIKAILVSDFIKIHFLCDFTQKYKFTVLKKIRLISYVDWRSINTTYSWRVLLYDFYALMPLVA